MSSSAEKGLSAAEVAERVARGEVNRVRRSDAADYLDICRRNLLTVFNALVAPAAGALLVLGDYRAGISVSGMMIVNTALGLAQEIQPFPDRGSIGHLAILKVDAFLISFRRPGRGLVGTDIAQHAQEKPVIVLGILVVARRSRELGRMAIAVLKDLDDLLQVQPVQVLL